MTEEEKTLELAGLMGWYVWGANTMSPSVENFNSMHGEPLQPYLKTESGLAQFASILLKFPEVFEEFMYKFKPVQKSILDEILKMNGIEI